MALTPDCLTRLQLRQAPFEAVPDAAFVYTDAQLDGLNARVLRSIASPGAIVILDGGTGSGRSTQLMRLLGALPSELDLVAFRGRANTRFAAVDVTIRNALGADGADRKRPLAELLIERNRRGIEQFLAIDDAHLLGTDILHQLLRLRGVIAQATGRGPRLLLVDGAGSLRRDRQAFEAEGARLVTTVSLPCLDVEQTHAYLAHRLRAAGCEQPATLIGKEAAEQLHQCGKGNLTTLNALAEARLTRLCGELSREDGTTDAPAEEATQPHEHTEPPPSEARMPEPPPAGQVEPARPKTRTPLWIGWWLAIAVALIVTGLVTALAFIDWVPSDSEAPRDPIELESESESATPLADVPDARAADLAWLAAQDGRHHGIQLIALRERDAIERYIADNGLKGAHLIPSGSLTFAVIGSFADRESALAALEELPARVLAQGYWIRPISDIQADARP